jgi:hypothetical protein
MNRFRFALAPLLSMLLAACGGGGGGGEREAIDQYVGAWSSCKGDTIVSVQWTLVIEKSSAASAHVKESAQYFESSASPCSGQPLPRSTAHVSEMAVVGSRQVDGETVDQVDLRYPAGTSRQIAVVRSDAKLYMGGKTDSNYPSSFQNGWVFNRQ